MTGALLKSYKPPLGARWKMYGVDLSHHQKPHLVNYEALPEVAIFRATYGAKQDSDVVEHFKRARAQAPRTTRLGLYHFYRPSQTVDEQLHAFLRVLDLVGYQAGDVVPILDLERDPFAPTQTPEFWHKQKWFIPADTFAHKLGDHFGNCILYGGSQWMRQFCGAWTDDFPIWHAEYRGVLNRLGPRPAKQHNVIGWQFEGRPGQNHHLPGVYKGQALDVNVWSHVPVFTTG